MKKLLIGLLAGLCLFVQTQAQGLQVFTIPATTTTNILQGQFRLQSVTFVSSSTNTVANDITYLLDTRRSSTNIIYPAYYSYYETNFVYTNIYTNTLGVLTTNYFNAITNVAVSNATTTSSAPILTVISTLGLTQPVGRNLNPMNTALGLTVYSSTAGTLYVTYGPAF